MAAIQAAINAATGGGVVDVPIGTHVANLVITNHGITLRGASSGYESGATFLNASKIQGSISVGTSKGVTIENLAIDVSSSGSHGISVQPASQDARLSIRNVKIAGSGNSNGYSGIYAATANYVDISDVFIKSFSYGVRFEGVIYGYISRVRANNCSSASVYLKADGRDCRNVSMSDLFFLGNSGLAGGIVLDSGANNLNFVQMSNIGSQGMGMPVLDISRNGAGSLSFIQASNLLCRGNTTPTGGVRINGAVRFIELSNVQGLESTYPLLQGSGFGSGEVHISNIHWGDSMTMMDTSGRWTHVLNHA